MDLAMKMTGNPELVIEYWPVERLKPYERNPRKNDKAVERIRASIREFGFAVPILAKSDGEVINGHLRLKGAVAEQMAEVPVIPCDGWTEAQVRAFRLMVNRSVTCGGSPRRSSASGRVPRTECGGRNETRQSRSRSSDPVPIL